MNTNETVKHGLGTRLKKSELLAIKFTFMKWNFVCGPIKISLEAPPSPNTPPPPLLDAVVGLFREAVSGRSLDVCGRAPLDIDDVIAKLLSPSPFGIRTGGTSLILLGPRCLLIVAVTMDSQNSDSLSFGSIRSSWLSRFATC